MDLLQREPNEISSETRIRHMTCYILNIVSHSNLLLNAIYFWSFESEALLYRRLGYILTCGCRWRTLNRRE